MKILSAKPVVLILLSVILISISCKQKMERTTSPPNIILMLADDLGYNDLSVYRNATPGQSEKPPTCQTPNIDQLAEEGMRFTSFYCGAAVCSPSRAAIISGRNATRVGIYNWIPPRQPMHLRAEEVTIAEMLKSKAYETAHFGKWHLTSEGMGQPLMNDQGYDYSFFTYNNANPSHENPENFFRNGDPVGELEGYACQLVVDEAIQWLDQKKSSEKPFYINVWFNEPHEKVAAPDSLANRHEYNQEYYGCIENMDYAVGRLMSYLKENKLEENTLVVFSSDNGSQKYGSNYPLRGAKAFNYEGGVRVPFIARWPAAIPAGTTSDAIGSFTDVLPTIADLCGAPLPDRKLDGVSLAQVFTGELDSVERKHPVFFYRYFHDPVCMMREGDWSLLGYEEVIPYSEQLNTRKWAKFKPGPDEPSWAQWGFQEGHMEAIPEIKPEHFELYNLKNDIGQKRDLAAKYPEKTEQMKIRMLQLREEMIKEGGNWYISDSISP